MACIYGVEQPCDECRMCEKGQKRQMGMERLTEKRDGQNVIPLRQDGKLGWALSSAGIGNAPTQFLYGVHADKLAEYEEIGTVEDFKKAIQNVKTLSDMYEKLNDKEVAEYHELAEYKELEKQGKLPKLPCAVGDTVYEVQAIRKRIQEYTIIAIHISNCGNLYGWELKDGKGVYSNLNGFSEYAIGKAVFLTKEEAEAVLKELRESNETD